MNLLPKKKSVWSLFFKIESKLWVNIIDLGPVEYTTDLVVNSAYFKG